MPPKSRSRRRATLTPAEAAARLDALAAELQEAARGFEELTRRLGAELGQSTRELLAESLKAFNIAIGAARRELRSADNDGA